jgi:hypothetical protein
MTRLPWLLSALFASLMLLCAWAEPGDRIEREDRLLVPLEQADRAWAFMLKRFVEDQDFLKSLDPRLSSTSAIELFTDTYFDDPDLTALGMQAGVRHRRRVNLTNPNDRKNGRELVQVKLSGDGVAGLQRTELKWKVRNGSGTSQPGDTHPLLGLIKRAERDSFRERLAEVGLDAEKMHPVLTITDRRQRVYLLLDGQSYISMTLDYASASVWGVRARFVEFEPEPGEIVFTAANQKDRQAMIAIIDRVIGEMTTNFPGLKRDLTPKYNKMMARLEAENPAVRTLVNVTVDQVVLLICLLVMLPPAVWLFFRCRRGRAAQHF